MDFPITNAIIQGSPNSTYGKTTIDGSVETYADIASRSRKQISYHDINGTDIPAIISSKSAGIVGSTINIQCRTENSFIDNSFEDLLDEHGEDKNFHTEGIFHRDEGFRQIVENEFKQGGVIIRHHYNSRWAIPYRLEFISVNMIDVTKTRSYDRLYNGLQKDSYNRITHIWIYTDEKKTRSKPISTRNMTYYFTKWMDLSQFTAVSRLVRLLPTLDGILQYSTAEVQAALERAKSGHYWHTELYSILQDALDEEFRTSGADPSTKVLEAQELLKRLASRGVGVNAATPTPKDDKITVVDTKTDTVYDTLAHNSQKAMASAVGGSQVSVYKDINIGNYASLKAAISHDEESYLIEFDKLKNKVIKDYIVRLFRVGVQIGRIMESETTTLSKVKYFQNPRAYHKFDVLRTSKRSVDEEKSSKATAKNLEMGTTTLNKVYAEKGLDQATETMKQVDIDIQVALETKRRYEAVGLKYPGDLQTQEEAKAQEQKQKEEEEKKLEAKLKSADISKEELAQLINETRV